jgi:hypothetical protein
MRHLPAVLLIVAGLEVVFLRWVGRDMTEGQLLIEFAPAWASVVVLVFFAVLAAAEE